VREREREKERVRVNKSAKVSARVKERECGMSLESSVVATINDFFFGHNEVDRTKPLPLKGYDILWVFFPNEQPGGRGPSLKKFPNFFGKLGLFFRGGSSSSRL